MIRTPRFVFRMTMLVLVFAAALGGGPAHAAAIDHYLYAAGGGANLAYPLGDWGDGLDYGYGAHGFFEMNFDTWVDNARGRATVGVLTLSGDYDVDQTFVTISAIYGLGMFHVLGGVGMYDTDFGGPAGPDPFGYSYYGWGSVRDFGIHVGAGTRIPLGDRLSMNIEGTFHNVRHEELTGISDLLFHGTFSVGYHF